MEETASSHLGHTVDTLTLRAMLNKLYSPEKKTGIFADNAFAQEQQRITEARKRVEAFFKSLDEWLQLPGNEENPLCYRTPNHIPHWLEGTFNEILSMLDRQQTIECDDARKAELNSIITMLKEANQTMADFFSMSLPDHVYWFDRFSQRSGEISLNIVPVDVSNALQEYLFCKPPVIITSATLAVNGDISIWRDMSHGATEAQLDADAAASVRYLRGCLDG